MKLNEGEYEASKSMSLEEENRDCKSNNQIY